MKDRDINAGFVHGFEALGSEIQQSPRASSFGRQLQRQVIPAGIDRPRLSASLDNRCSCALGDLIFPCLLFPIQHHLVESLWQGLAARVRAWSIGAGLDSCLREF